MRVSFEGSRVARMLPLFLALAGTLLLLACPAAADEPGVEDEMPQIVDGALTPSTLGFEGGNVQISAKVVDDVGVSMVFASIYGPNGIQGFQLFEGGESVYYGTLEVPSNFSEFPVGYSVEVGAYDTINNYSATLIGEVQVEAAPQFDEFPYVSEATVTPQLLPAAGGTVTISAEAGDTRALSTVFATVSTLAGTTEVALTPISFSRFEGTFAVPANSGPLADEYVVEVVAQDDIGQETRASAGIVTVEPPPVLSLGRLEILPGDRSLGNVRLGKTATRKVSIRNLPRRGGGPVEATVQINGSPAFGLASPEAIHFSLLPGEKLTLPVQFRPTTAGAHSATLEVVRDDGGQPGLAVGLSGRGVSR
jgi:hypothetical protein